LYRFTVFPLAYSSPLGGIQDLIRLYILHRLLYCVKGTIDVGSRDSQGRCNPETGR
jgi:hypothetical protein